MVVRDFWYIVAMNRRTGVWAIGFVAMLSSPAWAGMPSIRFTEIGEMRVQVLSFFLLVFLVTAGIIQRLWNWLRRDFTFLPRLTFGRSLGLVGLWGLLFILVLTMISGARELMTPGAWEPRGMTYKLKSGPPRPPPSEEVRWAKLQSLKDGLWSYASMHAGKLPSDPWGSELPIDLWETPDLSRIRYIYRPGQSIKGNGLIAYEPPTVGRQLGLFADGGIREIVASDLRATEPGGDRP